MYPVLDCFPRNFNYSVYVKPYLHKRYFEMRQESKQKERESNNIVDPDVCLSVLIDYTGLKHLRVYDSGKVIFLYFPHYKCYFEINESNLATIISRILFDLNVPSDYLLKDYLDNVAKLATYYPQISYLGIPENDIENNLVSVGNRVLDLKKGIFIEDASPELFVVNYHDPSK